MRQVDWAYDQNNEMSTDDVAPTSVLPALYYPYIHIRSEHWLKATLLTAPTVKRIVPENYTPEDEPNIVRYTTIAGPHGKLLKAVPSFTPAAHEAQLRLLQKLQENAELIRTKYDRNHAPRGDEYWIHEAKFIGGLLDHLRAHHLAWPSHHSRAYGHRTWYALHPILGKAIMTTLGLSIAREQRYDIVTAEGAFHEALLATKAQDVFDALLHDDPNDTEQTRSQARQNVRSAWFSHRHQLRSTSTREYPRVASIDAVPILPACPARRSELD